jgi:hypothetical protein
VAQLPQPLLNLIGALGQPLLGLAQTPLDAREPLLGRLLVLVEVTTKVAKLSFEAFKVALVLPE